MEVPVLAPPSEASTRRPKRGRSPKQRAQENDSISEEAERQSLPDDFDETRGRSKRNRGNEGTASAAAVNQKKKKGHRREKMSQQQLPHFIWISWDISTENNSFSECKSLAAQLSGTFIGAARNKHRQDILKIVKDGIDYAFVDAPKHLSFLEAAVLHFVSKLPASDVLEILEDVQKRTENVNKEENPSGWRPYNTFVQNLWEKYAKNESFQDEKEGVSVRCRGRPRKRQNISGKRLFDDHSSSEDEDSISASEQDAHDGGGRQDEDDEDAPLIHSIRSSSKLRSLGVSREESNGQTKTGNSMRATDNLSASRTSGASN